MIIIWSDDVERIPRIECEDSWNYHGHRTAYFEGNSLEELKAFIAEHENHREKEPE